MGNSSQYLYMQIIFKTLCLIILRAYVCQPKLVLLHLHAP